MPPPPCFVAPQARLEKEKTATDESEWGPWVYDEASGKRRRKKKRKKKLAELEAEAFGKLGTTGETVYGAASVLDDATTAWAAGLRDGGAFAFASSRPRGHRPRWRTRTAPAVRLPLTRAETTRRGTRRGARRGSVRGRVAAPPRDAET